MTILVTGGAGYIGSHTCVELLNAGYDVVIIDNLYNTNQKAVDRSEEITGKQVKIYPDDMMERARVKRVVHEKQIRAANKFAGLKAVGHACEKPNTN
mgnify:CR=1 FL=1